MSRPAVLNLKSAPWPTALRSCADPERARQRLQQLATLPEAATWWAGASSEQARIWTALLAGTRVLGEWLLAHPEWLGLLTPETLERPRTLAGLRREIAARLKDYRAERDGGAAFTALRQFKQRELLRIATRDLARLGDVREITRELSNLADACLETALALCHAHCERQFGLPYHQDAAGQWHRTGFCVLGLGKLGGQELNYHSDVDLLFVYAEEGHVFPRPPAPGDAPSPRALTNHQFFDRLAKLFLQEVTRLDDAGTLYRIDLRLRPEGESGPLVRSLSGYENYYAQWGQTWERMMLLKARGCAGDAALAAEFLETIQSFRYPRSLSEGVLREIAAIKQRIEDEVVRSDELERNVKLGRGGIREIEFVVQTRQILQGGRQPFLQDANTLSALEKLVKYHVLPATDAAGLAEAYCFLRNVEHRLQMEDNLQTHTIPTAPDAQQRLARLMGFRTAAAFERARRRHTTTVRRIYDAVLRADAPEPASPLPPTFSEHATAWKELLAQNRFRDPERAFRLWQEFAEGPGYVHVSARTVELARQLIPRFLALCPREPVSGPRWPQPVLSDPDRVLTRLDTFVAHYGARATLFESWTHNPAWFELLLWLFDRSEFLAEVAIRTPDLLEELIVTGQLRRRKTAPEILAELRQGRHDADQHRWLRRYHQAEVMRIGLRDLLGYEDLEEVFAELSALAVACLQYALEVTVQKHRLPSAPFAIIGLGKLGGQELGYGSDLDIVFVADARTRNLAGLQPVAAEIMDLLQRRTEDGVVFLTDARLRPDGEKGLLVNTLPAYESYYRQRAQLWEIQALTRVRPVAGDAALGAQFQQLAAALADFRPEHVAAGFPWATSPGGRAPRTARSESTGLAAWAPDWKQRIHQMRLRIERERTPPGKDALAIKTGVGGLMDAEFIAQTMCLEHGWAEAHTLRALERARDTGALPPAEAERLLANYRELRRVEGILRRWSYEGEVLLPDDPAPFYRVSVRCGFTSLEAFREALAAWRAAMREIYLRVSAG